MAKVPFPMEAIGEFTVARKDNPSGMFFYRYLQTDSLLHFPDFSGCDMIKEEINSALNNSTALRKPLRAISIMMSVVALEDLIRRMGDELSNIQGLKAVFPSIELLKITIDGKFSDEKGVFGPVKFDRLNTLYQKAVGIDVIGAVNIPRLDDLVKIRNILAHNAAHVSTRDAEDLKYYEVQPNQIINPTLDFLNEINLFLYNTGRDFTRTIRNKIFSEVISKLNIDLENNIPEIVLELIKFFNYFEKIVTSDRIPEGESAHDFLIQECIRDLRQETI